MNTIMIIGLMGSYPLIAMENSPLHKDEQAEYERAYQRAIAKATNALKALTENERNSVVLESNRIALSDAETVLSYLRTQHPELKHDQETGHLLNTIKAYLQSEQEKLTKIQAGRLAAIAAQKELYPAPTHDFDANNTEYGLLKNILAARTRMESASATQHTIPAITITNDNGVTQSVHGYEIVIADSNGNADGMSSWFH